MFVLSLACQKGGAGKSTIAMHLAIEAYLRKVKVLLVDIDPQMSATAVMRRRGEDPPDTMPGHAKLLEGAITNAEAEGYQLVVIDTAALADQSALLAARVSDLVLIPVRPSVMDLDAVGSSQDICSLARKPSLFVLNAVSPQGGEADECKAAIEERGGRVAATRIGNRKLFFQAFNGGRGAQEILSDGIAAKEIAALYDELGIPTVSRSHMKSRKVLTGAV